MTPEQIKHYHTTVADNIRKYGYHSTFVFSKKDQSFCYSTGIFKSFGIPELIISSLPQNLSHSLIRGYVNEFRNGEPIPLNQRTERLTDRFDVCFIEAPNDSLKDHVLSSIRFYGNEEYKYLQLVYPDTNGHFPGDRGYDYDQVLFGNFKS